MSTTINKKARDNYTTLITLRDVKEDQDNRKRITYTREKDQTSLKRIE